MTNITSKLFLISSYLTLSLTVTPAVRLMKGITAASVRILSAFRNAQASNPLVNFGTARAL